MVSVWVCQSADRLWNHMAGTCGLHHVRQVARYFSLPFLSNHRIAMHSSAPEVYVIDDDASVRVALKRLLTLVGFHSEVFGSIEEFMRTTRADAPSCLVLD